MYKEPNKQCSRRHPQVAWKLCKVVRSKYHEKVKRIQHDQHTISWKECGKIWPPPLMFTFLLNPGKCLQQLSFSDVSNHRDSHIDKLAHAVPLSVFKCVVLVASAQVGNYQGNDIEYTATSGVVGPQPNIITSDFSLPVRAKAWYCVLHNKTSLICLSTGKRLCYRGCHEQCLSRLSRHKLFPACF